MDEQRKEELLSRVEKSEWIYHFDPDHLRGNNLEKRNMGWRIANGLLYPGTYPIKFRGLGCGEVELKVDVSVTGADLWFWERVLPDKRITGINLRISKSGDIEIEEPLEGISPNLRFTHVPDPASVKIRVRVLRSISGGRGWPADKSLVTVFIDEQEICEFESMFICNGRMRLSYGNYSSIKYRGDASLTEPDPNAPNC